MKVFSAAFNAWSIGQSVAMVTVVGINGSSPRSTGARMLVFPNGDIVGTVGGGVLEHRAIKAALYSIQTLTPERISIHLTRDLGMCCGGSMDIYVEPIEGKIPITIFGAGHVSCALAPKLVALDYGVIVVDSRDEWLSKEAFDGCERKLEDPVEYAKTVQENEKAHWLVVTHEHQLDQDIVEALLPKQCAWVGMIGSRAKVAKFLVRYRAAGLDPTLFKKLSAPVGLDIGAETPEEIAIAITAELIRIRSRSDRTPHPLSSIPIAARGGNGAACPPGLPGNPTPLHKTSIK